MHEIDLVKVTSHLCTPKYIESVSLYSSVKVHSSQPILSQSPNRKKRNQINYLHHLSKHLLCDVRQVSSNIHSWLETIGLQEVDAQVIDYSNFKKYMYVSFISNEKKLPNPSEGFYKIDFQLCPSTLISCWTHFLVSANSMFFKCTLENSMQTGSKQLVFISVENTNKWSKTLGAIHSNISYCPLCLLIVYLCSPTHDRKFIHGDYSNALRFLTKQPVFDF